MEIEVNEEFQDLLYACKELGNKMPQGNDIIKMLVAMYKNSYLDFVNSERFRAITRQTTRQITSAPLEAESTILDYCMQFLEKFQELLKTCRSISNASLMDFYIEKLLKFYDTAPETYLKTGSFNHMVHMTTSRINNDPSMIYNDIETLLDNLRHSEVMYIFREKEKSSRCVVQ